MKATYLHGNRSWRRRVWISF